MNGSTIIGFMKSLVLGMVAIASIGVVGYAFFAYAFSAPGSTVHPAMKAVYNQYPARLYLHVFGSAVALTIGPFQFFESVRKRRQVHRLLGFTYFAAVLLAGVSGIAMAIIAYGGLSSRIGFGMGAVLWLYTAGNALAAIRKRDFAAHEAWATRCFALTFAAVTLRIYLGLFSASGVNFDDFYPALGWISWVPNLIFAEWYLIRSSRRVA
jgi:uncharacterized membrane protein